MVMLSQLLAGASESARNGSASLLYGIIALISLLLALGYLFFNKYRERKLLLLYVCVSIANAGYLLLALSGTLTQAMMANRISYFGNAFSVMLMLMIIVETCGFRAPKWVTASLICVSTLAFLVAACGDWKGLYYVRAAIETVNGATRLVKVYGPLHNLYSVYLYGYVLAMFAVILYAIFHRDITTGKHAILLVSAVLGNIGVWFVEQLIQVNFEFLSISMVLTEVILMMLYGMLRDHQNALEKQLPAPAAGTLPRDLEALFAEFLGNAATLSSAEKRVLGYYIEGYEISEIPELAYISIHTVKKHNRSIYQKLGVASRDDLMLFVELFRRSGRLDELTQLL